MSEEKQIIEEMALAICKNRMACDVDNCRKCSGHEQCLYQDIACALYREDYRKQSEWISVDERLPEKHGDVICYTRNGSIWQLTYNPKYRLFNVSSDNVEDAMDVDYWMPLPEAPKGGEK